MKFLDKTSIENLKKIFKIIKIYKKACILSAVLFFLVASLKLPMPLLTGYLIDNVILRKKIALLNSICGLLILLTIIYLLLNYLKDKMTFIIQTQIMIRLRVKLLSHVQQLKIKDISAMETGYLLARIMDDPYYLSGLLFQSLFNFAQSIITLLIGIIVIFTINWRLSLVTLIILPFFVKSNSLFIDKIKYWTNRIKEQKAIITKELSGSLRAIKITKLFLLYGEEKLKFFKNLRKEFEYSMKQFNYDYLILITSGFFAALGPLVVVWFGGFEIINNRMTIGQLVAFSSLLGFLFNPAKTMLNIHIDFQKSLVSLNRIYEILMMPIEETYGGSINKYRSPRNFDIEFKNISSSYNGLDKVLEDINLKITENETIALVGPIGSGKSTLIHLLIRLYDPIEGAIFIGGVNIKDIPLKKLRDSIGVVSQKDFLFSTSIYDNIRLGNLKAGHEDIIQATHMANAYDFIKALPNGFDTAVGEGGEFLSGGQLQLISLARVLLKKPPILILDEPTSAVDSNTEKLIQEALKQFARGRLTIIISHRLSTIVNADRVVIMENGRIMDIGSHTELLMKNIFYTKIYNEQIDSFIKKIP